MLLKHTVSTYLSEVNFVPVMLQILRDPFFCQPSLVI
jgi:hypothetical protein